MSSTLRLIASNARFIARPSCLGAVRAFHSPYVVLGESPLKSPPPSKMTYEKQLDHAPEPQGNVAGQRTYVVSQPDAHSTHYQVPSGAYPTSAPYVNFTATEAPNLQGTQVSSTSASLAAHPQTTRTVPHNNSGVGESASVRYAEAPGEMGERGGSRGGLGMMDKEGTTPPELKPTERNPPPDGKVAEKFSKLGLKDAWKERR